MTKVFRISSVTCLLGIGWTCREQPDEEQAAVEWAVAGDAVRAGARGASAELDSAHPNAPRRAHSTMHTEE
jgi:hypothetical protein